MLTFSNPALLALALLAVPMVVLGLRWFGTMSRARAIASVTLRAVLFALLAMMLAGAAAVRESDRLAVVAVVDVSDSVRAFAPPTPGEPLESPDRSLDYLDAVQAFLTQAGLAKRPDDLLGVVAFDGEALALLTPTPGDPVRLELDARINPAGTDLAAALRFAEALFPAGAARRLLLVSDGVQTAGDARDAARALAASSDQPLPIDVLPVGYRVENEIVLEQVDVPPQAPRESTVAVRVVLSATAPATGSLDLLYEGRPLDLDPRSPSVSRRLALRSGRNTVTLEVPLDDQPVHRFQPVFTPDDPAGDRIAANNRAETFTVTPGSGRALVVRNRPDPADSPLVRTLRAAGVDVEPVTPADVPNSLLALEGYSLVILDNVPADALERTTHRALADYVTVLGGGLAMLGGPDSFGAGGWRGTELEPLLPVKLELPDRVLTPQAAIAFVIDASGSMGRAVLGGARSQQQIANESVALALSTLDPNDRVAVYAFADETRTVVPTMPVDDAAGLTDRVRSITPGGGTNLYPALAEAGRSLARTDAVVKHVVVLSDGEARGDPALGAAIAQDLREQNITTTTIAVGDEADVNALARIASVGGGEFFQVIDPNTLPQIFVKAVRVVRRPLVREARFAPRFRAADSPITAGVPRDPPPLLGLALTDQRDDPLVTLAMTTPEDEPLLAHWVRGRGRVAAWTADADNWAGPWLEAEWPGYAQLFTQLARTIARPAADRDYELTTEIVGGALRVRLDAADDAGDPLDLLTVDGFVQTPAGERRPVTLSQTGPGQYETELPAETQGAYVVALTPRRGATTLPPVVGGASRTTGPEFRSLSSNIALLSDLADATGGRRLDFSAADARELFDRADLPPARASTPLWPLLLAWSVVFLLLDVGSRRVAWDRLLGSDLRWAVRDQALDAALARAQRARATVSGLRSRKARPEDQTAQPATTPSPAPDRPTAAPRPPRPTRPTQPARRAENDPAPTPPATRPGAHAAPDDDGARAARRKALRARMLQQLSGGKRPPDADDPAPDAEPDPAPAKDADAPKPTRADLLAAKRRAADRYRDDDRS